MEIHGAVALRGCSFFYEFKRKFKMNKNWFEKEKKKKSN